MKNDHSRPFYFLPPWNILFDSQMLEKANPWDISVSFLLLSFLEEMEKRAEIDFRASGVALGSSATVYLMKSKLLLKLEEPPPSPTPRTDFIPPPLILPLRYELTTTTIGNLLEALDNALKTEKFFTLKTPLKATLPPPPEIIPTVSMYLMEMEELMERLLHRISSLAERGRAIAFSRVVRGLGKLEQIRTFIVLLFLAHKGKIDLWQEEKSDEMFITIKGG